MKKQILLGAFFLGALFTAGAQNSCATAVTLPAGSVATPTTTTVGEINGTYVGGCFANPQATFGEWYMYAATTSGMLRINTNLPANVTEGDDTDDTRVSVYTGTCAALTCYQFSDDVNANTGLYLTDFEFPVVAGTTYYIQFDNRWSATGFDVEVSFEAMTCFPVSGFVYTEAATTTTASIGWNAPVAGTPVGYEFEYGPFGYTQGTGTSFDVTENEIALTGLNAGTDYEFYVRTDCGDGDFSDWAGPIRFNTVFDAATPPYAYGFESPSGGGWTAAGGSWGVYADAPAQMFAQEGVNFAAAVGGNAAANGWLFSRDLNLTGGETVTVTYYVRKIVLEGETGNVNNLQVTFGTDNTAAAQTNVIATHNDYSSLTHEMQTATFWVPTTGVYNLGFHYTAPIHTATNAGGLVIDNITIDSALGFDNILASQFSVFPNPTTGVINIANADNALVNGVEIVDINGRTVKTAKFDNVSEAQVNIADLASGMYLMNISSDKGTTIKKIVKN